MKFKPHLTKIFFFVGNYLVLLFLMSCTPISHELSPAHKILSLKIVACATGNTELCSNSKTTSNTNTTTSSNNPSIPENTAPSSLVYSSASYSLTVNIAMASTTPSVTGSVTNCSSSPSLPSGLSLNSTSCQISGTPTIASVSTSYTITASNSSGNTSATISIQVIIGKRIFVTASGYRPQSDFNSAVTADVKCNTDANKPASGTYKAFIVSVARIASTTSNTGAGQLDWVLLPTQLYTRTDGTILGTTGANSLFSFPISNTITVLPSQYFTGMNGDWTNNGSGNCSNWTIFADATAGSGVSGRGDFTTNAILIGANGTSCNQSMTGQQLLCVEQ